MPKHFEIYVRDHFSAAHRLDGYPGACSRVHGHNFRVEVRVRAESLDSLGIGLDFAVIKNELRSILDKLDHQLLNEVPFFEGKNPTAEVIALAIHEKLAERLDQPGVRVSEIRVEESPDAGILLSIDD